MDEGLRTKELVAAARADAERTRRELRRSQEKVRAILLENSLLRREHTKFRDRIARLVAEIDQIHQSLGWVVIQKTRAIRERLLMDGTIRGRCWNACSRFVKNAMTAGTTSALRKPRVASSGS